MSLASGAPTGLDHDLNRRGRFFADSSFRISILGINLLFSYRIHLLYLEQFPVREYLFSDAIERGR